VGHRQRGIVVLVHVFVEGGGGGVVFCGEKWFYFGQTKLVGTLAKQRAHMLDFTKWTFGTSAAPVSFAFPQLL